MVWIFLGWSTKFPDRLENFRIASKDSRLNGFFWMFQKVSRWTRKFSDFVESFQIGWKVSG